MSGAARQALGRCPEGGLPRNVHYGRWDAATSSMVDAFARPWWGGTGHRRGRRGRRRHGRAGGPGQRSRTRGEGRGGPAVRQEPPKRSGLCLGERVTSAVYRLGTRAIAIGAPRTGVWGWKGPPREGMGHPPAFDRVLSDTCRPVDVPGHGCGLRIGGPHARGLRLAAASHLEQLTAQGNPLEAGALAHLPLPLRERKQDATHRHRAARATVRAMSLRAGSGRLDVRVTRCRPGPGGGDGAGRQSCRRASGVLSAIVSRQAAPARPEPHLPTRPDILNRSGSSPVGAVTWSALPIVSRSRLSPSCFVCSPRSASLQPTRPGWRRSGSSRLVHIRTRMPRAERS